MDIGKCYISGLFLPQGDNTTLGNSENLLYSVRNRKLGDSNTV
jgi:hypothetical protein